MAREETKRPRVGLALSGGVVRGAAHVGVVTALDTHNVPVDVVVGASAGSLVGCLVAAGFSTVEIQRHAEEMTWGRMAVPVWPRRGFVSFDPLEAYLNEVLNHATFADLPHPFACVAADMRHGTRVVLREGSVARAVRASCSVPGFVEPVAIGNHLLSDGSIIDNLPAGVARDLGADYVIGVDIFVPSFHRRFIGPLRYGLAAIELMVDRAGGGLDTCDCLITPDLAGVTYLRFSQRDDLFRRGAAATLAAIPGIKEELMNREG